MRVELVTVGDELLRGETVNTNAAWLGRELTERGTDITRVTVVPDDPDVIAEVIGAARERGPRVIVTGGLGPTHDDRTMCAIAAICGVDLVEHEGARQWFVDVRDRDPETLAPATLELPAGARFLPNDVGVAPGAVIDGIYVLPGVPEEMHSMFEEIADEFVGPDRYEATLDVAQPERAIAATLEALEERFEVTVGSYPGETVTVKIIGESADAVDQATDWLAERVDVATESDTQATDRP